jgi:hypothetical protein
MTIVTLINVRMKATTNVNVLQNIESKVKHSQQNILLPGYFYLESRSNQGVDQKPRPTPKCCSFSR